MTVAIKTYSLRLPEDAIEALQNLALVEGVQVADLGRRAILEFIDRTAKEAEANFARATEQRRQALEKVQSYVDK